MLVAEARLFLLAMTGQPPSPELSGNLRCRMISHRLQVQAQGGLERRLVTILRQLAHGRAASPTLRLSELGSAQFPPTRRSFQSYE